MSSDYMSEEFIKATDKTIDFIRTNPEKSMEIMAKYTGYDVELIDGMKPPFFRKSTENLPAGLWELEEKLRQDGVLEKQIDVDSLI